MKFFYKLKLLRIWAFFILNKTHMKQVTIKILVFIFTLPFVFAQSPIDEPNKNNSIANEIVASALRENRGYEMLKELCEIGPRLSGSEKSLRAIEWAKIKLEEIGADSIWLQPVMVPVWERGSIEKATLNSSDGTEKELRIASLGGSIGTPEAGITAAVLEVKDFDELQKKKDQAKGKIIFFNRPFDNSLVNTFAAYGKAVDQRVYGAIEKNYFSLCLIFLSVKFIKIKANY